MKRFHFDGNLDPDDWSYVHREADADLYVAIRAGKFCFVFNSRQMGKSSLMGQTMKRLLAAGICCVAVDLTGTTSPVVREWYVGLMSALHDDLSQYFSQPLVFEDWLASHPSLPPVPLFKKYLKDVVLGRIPDRPIVIFLDEIDAVLKLGEAASDFFALLRSCFNQRATDAAYQRLTFALFGVATPAGLIQDRARTPFNIGQGVALAGFEFDRSRVLAEGLVGCVPDAEVMLQLILDWTGGQPFLTQKLCDLVQRLPENPASGQEAVWLERLVRSQMIENWQAQDNPQHLRTIRDRLFLKEEWRGRLLGLYQQILQTGEIAADSSEEQTELCLSGLVVRRDERLWVYNRIYAAVFDQAWVEQALAQVRPYAERLQRWLQSEKQDESQLLREPELDEQLAKAKGKYLANDDNQFFAASQAYAREHERVEAEQKMQQIQAEEQNAIQRLAKTQRRTKRWLTAGAVGLAILTTGLGVVVSQSVRDYENARLATEWERR